ncbi:aspartate aminotransferase family protein [Agriterribacter sp.]|uniref:aminotransferase family protein n=1 Tax=Agriterribacter sp. TaxID=2821509 RepID=UPI002C7111D7|nr:aspartate aminotransferase family protein [Agriterribacter sp.]HRO45898.1 aspartate aminotransferase family protein [Agriterribacter sp.]HRO97275.1 aspartate aminotransferase family protein [Ferruginibacter sp.]
MNLTKYTDREKEELIKIGLENVITHWADNDDLRKEPKVFAAGEGCYVYDINGRKYLDTFSSLITSIIGHNRPEIKNAVVEQMDKLAFFPNYHDSFSVPLIQLAKKLSEIMPGDLEVSFFVNSGSEANETAIKLARQYFWQTGKRKKYKVISRKNSYHGTTIAAASYSGFPSLWEFLEPTVSGQLYSTAPNRALEADQKDGGDAILKEMEELIIRESADTIAALIMDPVPGSNSGYPIPPDGYLQKVRDLCNKYDIFLIFDEIQTGFGKTGKWFACENWNVTPDVITVSKALTAGYAPLGVAVTTKKIASVFKQEAGTEFRSGSTYGGHPVSCAVALANIEIMEKENLIQRAADSGKYIKQELEKLFKYKVVSRLQGMGMIWALRLGADRENNTDLDPKLKVGTFIRDYCWENGMILRNNAETLVIAPAIVMTKAEIDTMIGTIEKGIVAAIKHFGL